MTNKKLGNDFESELCEILFKEGFWVHNFTQNQAGQPADIIAVKNGYAYLIDAKVCSDNKFPISRIEENQHLAMKLWNKCGNGHGWFALKEDDNIYFLPHGLLLGLYKTGRTLTKRYMKENGVSFREWVRACEY